jgi:hypothetical protein
MHTGYQNHFVTLVLPTNHDTVLKIPVCPVLTLCTGSVIGVAVDDATFHYDAGSGSQPPNKGAKP